MKVAGMTMGLCSDPSGSEQSTFALRTSTKELYLKAIMCMLPKERLVNQGRKATCAGKGQIKMVDARAPIALVDTMEETTTLAFQ